MQYVRFTHQGKVVRRPNLLSTSRGVTVLNRMTVPSSDRPGKSPANGLSRAQFLKLTALAGGAAAAGRVLIEGSPEAALAAGRSPGQDRDIVNFLLQLEYVQAAFYKEAVAKGALQGDLARFARVASGHERAHVSFLRRKLGSDARPAPTFHFGDATSKPNRFAAVAIKLEELGLGAFVGQGANLTRPAALYAARIASVEGRHAAWVRDIQQRLPAPVAADRAIDQAAITSALRALGFSQ